MAIVATAQLKPFNNSGISATMTFVESDDGNTLKVTGDATGMSESGVYVSLVYGLQSNADVTGQTAPGPCVDDRTLGLEPPPIGGTQPGDLIFSPSATVRMLLDLWKGRLLGIVPVLVPVGHRNRMLRVTKPTAPLLGVHLNEIKTVSIREVSVDNLVGSLVDDLLDLNVGTLLRDVRPRLFSLKACGEIKQVP